MFQSSQTTPIKISLQYNINTAYELSFFLEKIRLEAEAEKYQPKHHCLFVHFNRVLVVSTS